MTRRPIRGGARSVQPIDGHIGRKILERRTSQGVSQTKLADALGITFQQIQKYEKGTNRITAGRLWEMAHVLEVPLEWFFEGLPKRPHKKLR